MTTDELPRTGTDTELRERAIKRLKKRNDFYGHLLIYVLFNSMLVGIWAITSQGFFWPIFPLMGWGIGVAANAWDVFRDEGVTEERIQKEIAHLQSRPR